MAIYAAGLRGALSLPAFMVLASMAGYGSMIHAANMDIWIGIVSTLGIWGMPGQVAFVEFVQMGAPAASILLAVSLANMRFLPMSLALMPLFRNSEKSWRWRYFLVQMMSVNTWVGISRRAPELSADQRMPYYLGFATLCMSAGVVGTAGGYLIAEAMPFYVSATLVLINPIYFVFVFAAMRVRSYLIALAIGALLGPLFHLFSPEWGLSICGLIAGSAGFYADRLMKRRSA